jgi:hypothetical protein
MSRKVYPKVAHGVRGEKPGESIFSKNHFASMMAIPRDVQFEIDSLMLRRVAGNVYECPADRSFWAVKGGRIIKLVGNEVDDGQSIPAAPDDKPAAFLANILDDLEF